MSYSAIPHMLLMLSINESFRIKCVDRSRYVMQNNDKQMQVLFCMKCGEYIEWSIHTEGYTNNAVCKCHNPVTDTFGQLMMELNASVKRVY
jgi:hypothetical protein